MKNQRKKMDRSFAGGWIFSERSPNSWTQNSVKNLLFRNKPKRNSAFSTLLNFLNLCIHNHISSSRALFNKWKAQPLTQFMSNPLLTEGIITRLDQKSVFHLKFGLHKYYTWSWMARKSYKNSERGQSLIQRPQVEDLVFR